MTAIRAYGARAMPTIAALTPKGRRHRSINNLTALIALEVKALDGVNKVMEANDDPSPLRSPAPSGPGRSGTSDPTWAAVISPSQPQSLCRQMSEATTAARISLQASCVAHKASDTEKVHEALRTAHKALREAVSLKHRMDTNAPVGSTPTFRPVLECVTCGDMTAAPRRIENIGELCGPCDTDYRRKVSGKGEAPGRWVAERKAARQVVA
jgi:hypothetical protein